MFLNWSLSSWQIKTGEDDLVEFQILVSLRVGYQDGTKFHGELKTTFEARAAKNKLAAEPNSYCPHSRNFAISKLQPVCGAFV